MSDVLDVFLYKTKTNTHTHALTQYPLLNYKSNLHILQLKTRYFQCFGVTFEITTRKIDAEFKKICLITISFLVTNNINGNSFHNIHLLILLSL